VEEANIENVNTMDESPVVVFISVECAFTLRLDGRLVFVDDGGEACFTNFIATNTHMAMRCAAFAWYTRTKNIGVRSGLVYGSDFVLYRGSGTTEHGYAVVRVAPRESAAQMSCNAQMSCKAVVAWQRVAASVGKRAILCLVRLPPVVSAETLAACVADKGAVTELQLSQGV
jgi:hypothetical protein